MPYVYQVTHIVTGEFYIGSKYASGATPENTKDYFGSSKGKTERCLRYKYLLKNERHLLKKTIIETFDTKEDALQLEIEMHNKLFNDSLCLNGAKQTSNKFSAAFKERDHPMFGKTHLDETRQKMRLAKLGKSRGSLSPEHKEKIRLAQVGKQLTEEHKYNLRLAKSSQPKVVCPHCNKQGSPSGMTRYHFDKCKQRGYIWQQP